MVLSLASNDLTYVEFKNTFHFAVVAGPGVGGSEPTGPAYALEQLTSTIPVDNGA